MAVFEYKGLSANGQAIDGILDADSPKIARKKLRATGIFPTSIREQQQGVLKGSGLNAEIDFAKYMEFVTKRDISITTKQLSTMLSASVPMSEALTALVDQADKDKLKVILSKIKERVNEGATLADAMADHPKVFNDLYVHMIRAGEHAGALDIVLKRLSTFQEGQVKLQGQVFSALAYPVLMGCVGTMVLMGMFMGPIPQVRNIFESIGGDVTLPLSSRLVFFIGDMLMAYWFLPPIFLVLAFVVFRRWVATEAGRERFDGFKLKVPIFGKVNRLVGVTRFCRTMATLLASGVPIVTALDIVRDVVGNVKLAKAIEAARHNITEGQSVAVPLKQSGEFPPLVTHMIAIGERTGELEPMLETVADSYEAEVETTMTATTALLGPLMILVIGGVVFVVALGLLQPMMQLTQSLQM
jgi:general secretion pathway protein F